MISFLAGKGLDKRFPHLHQLYTYLYKSFTPNITKTTTISLNCKLSYNLKNSGVGYYLNNFGKFEPKTTSEFLKRITTDDTVIDIGANIGYYSVLAGKKTGPKGKVVAIEPEPENINRLKQNITLNNLQNITIINQAVSNRTGNTKLFLSPTSSGEHSLSIPTKKSITVKTTTLDKLVDQLKIKPNLIKIDVEGAEHQVLEGAIKTLKRYHPHLILEYSNRTNNKIFNLDQLTNIEYQLFWINEKQNKTHPITTKGINQKLKTQAYIQLLAIYQTTFTRQNF